MDRVDRILRYLEKDLPPDEARALEEEMGKDPSLKMECEDIGFASSYIRGELQFRDEELFKKKLVSSMEKADKGKSLPRRGPSRYGRWFLGVAAALTLVVLLVFRPGSLNHEKLYHPLEDPILLAMDPYTRNGELSYYSLFSQQKFDRLYSETGQRIREDTTESEAKVFHLLAAIELGRLTTSLERCRSSPGMEEEIPQQVLRWYRSLALISVGRDGEAVQELRQLVPHPGPYQADAQKLLKLLTK